MTRIALVVTYLIGLVVAVFSMDADPGGSLVARRQQRHRELNQGPIRRSNHARHLRDHSQHVIDPEPLGRQLAQEDLLAGLFKTVLGQLLRQIPALQPGRVLLEGFIAHHVDRDQAGNVKAIFAQLVGLKRPGRVDLPQGSEDSALVTAEPQLGGRRDLGVREISTAVADRLRPARGDSPGGIGKSNRLDMTPEPLTDRRVGDLAFLF